MKGARDGRKQRKRGASSTERRTTGRMWNRWKKGDASDVKDTGTNETEVPADGGCEVCCLGRVTQLSCCCYTVTATVCP